MLERNEEFEERVKTRAYSQALELLEIHGDRDPSAALEYLETGNADELEDKIDLPISALAHMLAWAASFPKTHTVQAMEYILVICAGTLPKIAADFDRELVRKGKR